MSQRVAEGPIRVEYWPLTDVLAHPRNPHDHDVGLIQQSMSRWGYTEPVVIDEKSGRLAAGHGRCKTLAGMKLAGEKPPERIIAKDGEWWIPVVRGIALKDDLEHQAYLVASNRIVEAGGWVDDILKDVLVQVGANTHDSLTGIGFDVHDVERMVGQLDKQRGPADVPDIPDTPWIKPGDLFALGDHRLLCGDSTDRSHVNRLLRGEALDVLLTAPPDPVGTDAARLPRALELWDVPLAYLFATWKTWTAVTRALEDQRFTLHSMIVWDVGQPHGGRAWLDQHELIACATRRKGLFPPSPARGNLLRGDRANGDEKPVEVLKDLLGNTSHEIGRTIGEPFCGSGSTLIACETLTRTCYAMERSPQLAQVALERWQRFSGRVAEQIEEEAGAAPVRGRKAAAPAKRRR
jgi:hypothetical protein